MRSALEAAVIFVEEERDPASVKETVREERHGTETKLRL